MNLGYKHLIDNDGSALSLLQADGTAATVKADCTDIHIKGLGKFAKANLALPTVHRYVAPSVFENVVTITAGTLAAASDVTLQLEIFSDRNTADMSREHQRSGKLISFTARVAAGATATAIATALETVINARITKYDDLPFTVERAAGVLTLEGIAGQENIVVKLAYDAVKVITADSQTRVIAVVAASESVTEPVAAVNDGAWIEENIAMNTIEAVRLGSVRPLEAVNRSSKYTSIYFEIAYTSDAVAEPSSVGDVSQAGTVKFGIYLDETALPTADTDAYAVLVDMLTDVTGFTGFEEDGGAITGADLVAVQDFFGYGAGDVD